MLVAPARVSETMGALGVIHRSEQDIESEEMAMQVGRIIRMSPLAFNYASKEEWVESGGEKPKVGDIVWYARYAGALVEKAFDGRMYRMIKDKDVASVVEPPAPDSLG